MKAHSKGKKMREIIIKVILSANIYENLHITSQQPAVLWICFI